MSERSPVTWPLPPFAAEPRADAWYGRHADSIAMSLTRDPTLTYKNCGTLNRAPL